jgi:hypothetical protein
MRIFLVKGLSLAVSIGTLAYIVTHAAVNTGCAASRPHGEPQFARSEVNADVSKTVAPASTANCTPVYMMPATKAAPVFRADECTPSGLPPRQASSIPQGQAAQQAP